MSDPMQLTRDIEQARAEAEEAIAKAQALADEQAALLALAPRWFEPDDDIPDEFTGWFPIFCPIIDGAVGYVRPPELIEVNGDNDLVDANLSYMRSQFGERMTVRQIIEASAKASSYAYAELVSEAIAKRVEDVRDREQA